jgi:hypothetical protein
MSYVHYGSVSLCFPDEVRGSSLWRIHRIVTVTSAVAQCRKGADSLIKWGQADLPYVVGRIMRDEGEFPSLDFGPSISEDGHLEVGRRPSGKRRRKCLDTPGT